MLEALVLHIAGERVTLRWLPSGDLAVYHRPAETCVRSSNPSAAIVATGTASTTTGSSSVSSARPS